ncbi:MAG: hypothetical protein K1X85_12260 [Ignavibacteria bacterium]|nr:hypothetical protein [Ignavibacteria bacterium]
MALVNSLKFSYHSGAIITDEEYFIGGRRRVHTADNMRPLITEEMSNELGLEAVYGGSGNIAVTNEVIDRITRSLAEKYAAYKRSGSAEKMFFTVEDVSRIALSIFQSVSKDMVNKKLKGLFGFGIDDFNRCYYMKGEEKVEIKEDKIVSKAMDFIMLKGDAMKDLNEIEGIIIGTDGTNGFTTYDFYGGMTHLYISTSLYNAVGAGSTTTSLAFGELINKLSLDKRRMGVDRVFGLVELIRITNLTALKNSEVGGYYDIIYIDGAGKSHNDRYLEITGNKSQFLKELVGAYDCGLVSKEFCFDLTDRIVFQNADFDLNEAENILFANATDPGKLDLFMRGYKA